MIHWELCKRSKLDHTTKWYMHKPESIPKKWDTKIPWDFEIQMDHLIPVRRPNPVLINKKKKRNCYFVDFAVSADHRMKIKQNKKINKYLGRNRELKKQWNMKVTVVLIAFGALWTTSKNLEEKLEEVEIRGRVGTTQTTSPLISSKIIRGVLETWGDLLSLKLQGKTPHQTGTKIPRRVKKIDK